MTKHAYSYVVLRYGPDPGAGEGLNIGVVVYSQQVRFLRLLVDSHYERLSQAFAGFDGLTFRRAVANIVIVFRAAERTFRESPLFVSDRSFVEWLTTLMPDTGAALSFTPARHGITSDLDHEITVLFDRMVESQKAHADERPRRDDGQVWRECVGKLSNVVSGQMTRKSFATSSVKVDFDHAVKNGRWHVVQPLSMDFKRAESLQRKASQWVGTAVGLHEAADLGTIIFLMGRPSSGSRKAYERAKALLNQVPVDHQIIEEQETDKLNRSLLALLEQHHE
ncbi:MAG: DUF3037 domain-containing protein [Acidobacteria bacterium]|nr:DUF3037 domain-containing protein [Acidobacteriota bacterium]